MRALVRAWLGRLAVATAFLTRLPIALGEVGEVDLARSLPAFPAVGLLLGAGLAVGGAVLPAALPGELRAVLLVGVLAGLTGGLHLDGVADLCDALGGGRGDRARMLELMRDSRIGAHGAVGVALVLFAKVAALAAILARPGMAALLLFPAAARAAVVPCIAWFRYAREEGLGAPFRSAGGRDVGAAALLFGSAAALCADPARALAAGALAAAVALGLCGSIARRLGGVTGDVYGAAIELAEVAFLTTWLAL